MTIGWYLCVGATGTALALASTAPAATVAGVYSSGVDAVGYALTGGNGATDLHYWIVGGTSSDAIVGHQAKTFDEFGWFMPDTAGSRAINATGGGGADSFTTIVFRTSFDLNGYAPASAMLSGTAQADDAASVKLNGHLIASPPIGYTAATSFAATDPAFFVAGINVLDFVLYNNTQHTALRVGNLTVSADRIAATVPEPATWASLVTGFGAVGAVARRRRRGQRVSISTSILTLA